MGKVIGIDFGTTNVRMAVWQQGNHIDVIPNDRGMYSTASFVAFPDDKILVGDAAMERISIHPRQTVPAIKRLMGCNLQDRTLQNLFAANALPYAVSDRNGYPGVRLEYLDRFKEFVPEEIASLIFFHCREVAEAYLKDQVTGVVISVPDQFGTLRRHSITAAARLAGLNVLRIVQDTALIGFNHIISHPISTSPLQNILILSVGSSYTNAAIASRKDGILEMQAVTGLSIGGNDFDARVFSHILGDFMMRTGKDIILAPRQSRRLKIASETTRRVLSSSTKAMTQLESFYDELDVNHTLTRDQFEQLCSDLFAQMHGIISRLIAATPVIGGFIHEVVLAGGASRMPGIRSVARQLLGQNILIHSVEQDNAVARGAAAIAATLSGPDAFVDFALVDVRPHSLRFQVGSDATRHQLTRRNRSVPTVANVSHVVTPGSNIQIHIWEEMIDGSEDACYLFKLPEIRSPRDPTAAELSIGLSLELSVDLDITLDLGGTQTRHKFDIESFLRPRKPMNEMADTLRQIMEEENSRNRRTVLLEWLSAYCTRLQDVADNRSEGESLKDRLLFSAQERDVIFTIVRQLQAFVEEGSAERRAISDIRGRIKIAEEVIDPILANAAKRMLGIAFLENV